MRIISAMRIRSFRLLVSLLLIIQLFNFSIDPADGPGPENMNINEIESFVELLIENIMGYENILRETDEGDDQSGQREGPPTYLFNPLYLHLISRAGTSSFQYNPYHLVVFDSLAAAIATPPPRSLNA